MDRPLADLQGSEEGPLVAAGDAIADAGDILRFAIADLRNIFHQIDGLTISFPPACPSRSQV